MPLARRATTALFLASLLLMLSSTAGSSQSRAPIVATVDVQLPSPPIPFTIAGTRHLAYELHITNFRSSEITVTRVAAIDAVRGAVIADYRDAELASRLARVGAPPPSSPPDPAAARVLAGGMRAVLYVWLAVDDRTAMPAKLQHRIELELVRAERREQATVQVDAVEVKQAPPLVLHPPLQGGPWVALYDPLMTGGHRKAIYSIDGRARIPARFAIDFIRLEDDGTHARGDRTQMVNWHGHGADVLAVADAIVVEALDDIAEAPTIGGAHAPVPLENASGNVVSLDLGGGRFAFYEHLEHGSIRVKAGDRVKRGQVLASLGNSGSSSSGPHLHFHVADTKSELGGEGLPYAYDRFEVIGAYPTIGAFATGARWTSAAPTSGTGGASGGSGMRTRELPGPNTVIMFPAAGRRP